MKHLNSVLLEGVVEKVMDSWIEMFSENVGFGSKICIRVYSRKHILSGRIKEKDLIRVVGHLTVIDEDICLVEEHIEIAPSKPD